jgi:hypothetical protein
MKYDESANLLDRIGVLRNRCDLDLLIFFARHPTALLTSEQLANWLGHELRAIAASLDVLLDARLIRREQNPSHAARMYVFCSDSGGGGWWPSLLRLAKTREGRLALIEAMRSRPRADAQPGEPSGQVINGPVLSLVRAPGDGEPPDAASPPERLNRHG